MADRVAEWQTERQTDIPPLIRPLIPHLIPLFIPPLFSPSSHRYATELEAICGLDISTHAAGMFKAKADIADLSAADVVLSDSKVFDVRLGVCVGRGGWGGEGERMLND